MAKAIIEIDIPDWSKKQLDDLIKKLMVTDDPRAAHLLEIIRGGVAGMSWNITRDEIIETAKCKHPPYPDGCHYKNCPNKASCDHPDENGDGCGYMSCWNYRNVMNVAADPQYLYGH